MFLQKSRQFISRYSVVLSIFLLAVSFLLSGYFAVAGGVYSYATLLYRLSEKKIGMAGVWIMTALIDTLVFELFARVFFILADRMVSFRMRASAFVNRFRYFAVLRNGILALVSLLILWTPAFLPFFLIAAGFLISVAVYGVFLVLFLKQIEPEKRPRAFLSMSMIYLLFLMVKSIWGLFA